MDALDRNLEALEKENALRTRLGSVGGNNAASIVINGSGVVALVVGAIGILGIVVAVAAVLVVSAWRDADMNDLTRVRGDVRELQAYRTQQERRINELEASSHGKSDPEG